MRLLIDSESEKTHNQELAALSQRVSEAEQSLAALQQWMSNEQRTLQSIETQMLPRFRAQNDKLRSVACKLPKHLPGAATASSASRQALAEITNRPLLLPSSTSSTSSSASSHPSVSAAPQPPSHAKAQAWQTPAKPSAYSNPAPTPSSHSLSATGDVMPTPAPAPAPAPAPSVSAAQSLSGLAYLTTAELEAVPKYMRARLTHAQINESIDELRALLQSKCNTLPFSCPLFLPY
jgi:hypothetical protein